MNLIVQALHAKYTAKRTQALAELSILLNNSVGISEHTNIIHECDEKIKAISEAEECIKTLQAILNGPEDSSAN